MSEHILTVNDTTFEERVLQSDLPVLVDFWAEWCGPCKAIAPMIDEIANDYAGKIKVAKMDIDSSPATPVKYGVRGIPTLILFKDGEIEATRVGGGTKSDMIKFIDTHI